MPGGSRPIYEKGTCFCNFCSFNYLFNCYDRIANISRSTIGVEIVNTKEFQAFVRSGRHEMTTGLGEQLKELDNILDDVGKHDADLAVLLKDVLDRMQTVDEYLTTTYDDDGLKKTG